MNIKVGTEVRVLGHGPAIGRDPIKPGDVARVIDRGFLVRKADSSCAHFFSEGAVELLTEEDNGGAQPPTLLALRRISRIH